MAFLDPVLHLAASAVDLLVEMPGLALAARERGDHEARVRLALGPFGLGNDTARPAPALPRRPHEALEAALRPAAAAAPRGGAIKLGRNLGKEPRVAPQPEQEIDGMGLAPRHELVAREACVAAQHNARPRPAGADAGDHPRRLLDGAGRFVHVGTPQLGDEQVPTTEHVERQVAVAAVIALEEPTLLHAMHRIVRRIEVQNDLASLARHRRVLLALGRQLAGQNRHHRIVAQLIVIIEVLVADRNREYPLANQGGHFMLDPVRSPFIVKARRKTINQPDRLIRCLEKQRARIRCHQSGIKGRFHSPPFNRSKIKRFCSTLCRHRGFSLNRQKSLQHNDFSLIRRPDWISAGHVLSVCDCLDAADRATR
jgi:hypothetical protein